MRWTALAPVSALVAAMFARGALATAMVALTTEFTLLPLSVSVSALAFEAFAAAALAILTLITTRGVIGGCRFAGRGLAGLAEILAFAPMMPMPRLVGLTGSLAGGGRCGGGLRAFAGSMDRSLDGGTAGCMIARVAMTMMMSLVPRPAFKAATRTPDLDELRLGWCFGRG
jgi:hypothetical protein